MIGHPLYQAVIDAPDNDEPRLVCADWLEERGDLRAEFIRLQIRLAGIDNDHPEWPRLKRQEQQLLSRYLRVWNGDAHRFLQRTPFEGRVKVRHGMIRRWYYQRGFIGSIDMDAKALAQHSGTVFRLGPIQQARLFLAHHAVDQLAHADWLLRFRVLELRGVNAGDIVHFAWSPRVRNLTELSIPNAALNTAATDALIDSPYLAGLRKLSLESCRSVLTDVPVRLAQHYGDRVRFHRDDAMNQLIITGRQEWEPARQTPQRSLLQRIFG